MSVGKRVTFQGADFIGLFYFERNCQNEVGNIAILLKRSCKNLVEFFFEIHKNGNNANIGIGGFISWKQKISVTECYPSIEPLDLWFQVQHAPLYTNLAFACKTETVSSLYSHALLILAKSSKSKHQVVHEQKFKDLLSSTCQISVERSMLDLESEVWWFNIHWGNILLLEFFVFT